MKQQNLHFPSWIILHSADAFTETLYIENIHESNVLGLDQHDDIYLNNWNSIWLRYRHADNSLQFCDRIMEYYPMHLQGVIAEVTPEFSNFYLAIYADFTSWYGNVYGQSHFSSISMSSFEVVISYVYSMNIWKFALRLWCQGIYAQLVSAGDKSQRLLSKKK